MRILLAAIAALYIFQGGTALAQSRPPAGPKPDTPVTSAKPPIPQRELDYIAIIDKARKQYTASRSIDARRNTRVNLQIAVHDFMGLSHSAENWVGVYKDNRKANDGRVTLEIEIAPNVTIATWSNPTLDTGYDTLMKPFSDLGKTALSFAIGDEVVFSANLIGSVIASDDDMVLHPQVIARFKALTKREPPQTPQK